MRLMPKNSRLALSLSKGFTLVELLVVMAILGVLTTLISGGFRSAQFRSRDVQRKSDLKQIASGLELYYSDYHKYPEKIIWGDEFTDSKTVYMKKVPKDPSTALHYYYRLISGQKFQLFAHLENTQDKNLITTAYDCGPGPNSCNFSITSSNTEPTEQ